MLDCGTTDRVWRKGRSNLSRHTQKRIDAKLTVLLRPWERFGLVSCEDGTVVYGLNPGKMPNWLHKTFKALSDADIQRASDILPDLERVGALRNFETFNGASLFHGAFDIYGLQTRQRATPATFLPHDIILENVDRPEAFDAMDGLIIGAIDYDDERHVYVQLAPDDVRVFDDKANALHRWGSFPEFLQAEVTRVIRCLGEDDTWDEGLLAPEYG